MKNSSKKMPLYRMRSPNGFGPWVDVTAGLFQQCCDCGLVHEMQFKVDERVRSEKGTPQVLLRARRSLKK